MAGIGGGLGGSVGIAAESTYGTWVTPTRFIEVRDFKMQERPKISQGTGLAYGRFIDLGSRRRETWTDAGGTLDLEFLNSGMALLLVNAMGSNATLAQIGTTSAYSLTANIGTPDNQNYMSMQALVPNTAGTLFQQNFHGCKVTKVTWTIDRDNPLMWSLDIDSQQVSTSESQATPSYTANTRTFTFQGMNFKVGAFGSEATIDGVKKMTVSIERGLEVNRIYMGQASKSEPVTNAVVKVTGSADVDLTATNKSVLWDLFHSQAAIPSIVMQFVGNAIGSSGSSDTLTLNPTNVYIDSGGTPELDGPDLVQATLNWSGLIDTSNDSAFKATLITADTGY
jgi:hypothetical protein